MVGAVVSHRSAQHEIRFPARHFSGKYVERVQRRLFSALTRGPVITHEGTRFFLAVGVGVGSAGAPPQGQADGQQDRDSPTGVLASNLAPCPRPQLSWDVLARVQFAEVHAQLYPITQQNMSRPCGGLSRGDRYDDRKTPKVNALCKNHEMPQTSPALPEMYSEPEAALAGGRHVSCGGE